MRTCLAIALVAAACGGGTKTTPVDNTAPTNTPTTRTCAPLDGDAEAAFHAYEAVPKDAAWNQRFAAAKQAATAGHAEGQAQAGGMLFSQSFTVEAPDEASEDDRATYVEALTWLFTSALRGNAYARGYAPDIETIAATRAIPAELDEPLGEIPRAWLEASLAAAVDWVACHDPSAH